LAFNLDLLRIASIVGERVNFTCLREYSKKEYLARPLFGIRTSVPTATLIPSRRARSHRPQMNLDAERDAMSGPEPGSERPLESFRSYLRMLAAAQLPENLRGQVDPSDVVQIALLKAHEHFNQYRGTSGAELAAWLRRILANAMIDALRRVTREPLLLQAVEQSSSRLEALLAANVSTPSEQAVRQEELECLAQALEQLPEDQRTAVQLQQIQDYSVEEIAKMMARSKTAVGGLLKRGMRRLRELMQKGGDHEGS
jgi:RNA polymerase sigma-70 factor, ECF subfamily